MNLQQRMKMKTTQSLQASFSYQQLHDSPVYRCELVFFILSSPSHRAVFLCPELTSSSPPSAPLLGLILATLVPLCSICYLWFSCTNQQNFLKCHFFLITLGSKNLLFSHWLPHSYKLFNSILGVKQITSMRVYLYIKAQTHGEYIKTQAHFNAVWLFPKTQSGRKVRSIMHQLL